MGGGRGFLSMGRAGWLCWMKWWFDGSFLYVVFVGWLVCVQVSDGVVYFLGCWGRIGLFMSFIIIQKCNVISVAHQFMLRCSRNVSFCMHWTVCIAGRRTEIVKSWARCP